MKIAHRLERHAAGARGEQAMPGRAARRAFAARRWNQIVKELKSVYRSYYLYL